MADYRYPHRFINQYARIPRQVVERLEAEFGAEYPGVRHCLGLILANMLAYGTVAYSRNSSFYTENRIRHYTYANMMRTADLIGEKGYAINTRGFRSRRYEKGISSILSPLEKLGEEFASVGRLELDVELLPLLEEYCYEDYSTLEKILGTGLIDSDKQQIRHELFQESRQEELVQALLAPSPELSTSSQAVISGPELPEEEGEAEEADATEED